MEQAEAYRAECAALERLLRPLGEEDYSRETAFKSWTVDDILRHLHVWDYAAGLSLTDAAAFREWIAGALAKFGKGDLRVMEADILEGLSGPALLDRWAEFYPDLSARFAEVDPSTRVEWAGPSMSARSSITARLMETWSHAQAIYDELGVERQNADHIQNIVVLGVNTYGWTFKNRGLPIPAPQPQLILTAPSGAEWAMGPAAGDERIEGAAAEFCQVVAQTRNIADTSLKVSGENAEAWMAIAQCFAGPPNDPPPPGLRRKKAS